MKYIIRFREKNEIITLELGNKGSADYVVKNLEKENIEYIVIKAKYINRDKDIWDLKNLLDYDMGKGE